MNQREIKELRERLAARQAAHEETEDTFFGLCLVAVLFLVLVVALSFL